MQKYEHFQAGTWKRETKTREQEDKKTRVQEDKK